jgi:hypothetical protein
MQNPAPLDRSVILTPAWLSEALGLRYPDVTVKSCEIVETLQTQATKIRFAVDYARKRQDVPHALCVKGVLGPEPQRLLAAGISEIETRFYQEIAPGLQIRVPSLIYGGIDPQTRHGLIIMEDMIAAGASFLTALTPYTVEQTAASLDQLARLHAACWHGRGLERYSWVPRRLSMLAAKPFLTVEALQQLLDGPRGTALPRELLSASRLHDALRHLAERTATGPQCLVHGDCHAGNLYENQSGPGLVDWQMLQQGSWALDVSYHLGAVLSVEVRQASEQTLLRHYLERLRAHGAEPPSFQEAWEEYRVHVVYGYDLWAVTRLVEPHITNEFVRRLGLAVAAHDSYASLGV